MRANQMLRIVAIVAVSLTLSCHSLLGRMEADAVDFEIFDDSETGKAIEGALRMRIQSGNLENRDTVAQMERLANIYITDGDLEKAEQTCKAALYLAGKLPKHHADLYFHCLIILARIEQGKWNYSSAREYYSAALQEGGKLQYPDELLILAEIYYQREEYDKAIENCRKIIKITKDEVVGAHVPYYAGRALAQILIQQGKSDEALKELSKIEAFQLKKYKHGSVEQAKVMADLATYKLAFATQHPSDQLNREIDKYLKISLSNFAYYFGTNSEYFRWGLMLYSMYLLQIGDVQQLTALLRYLLMDHAKFYQMYALTLPFTTLDNFLLDVSSQLAFMVYTAATRFPEQKELTELAMTTAYMLKARSAAEEHELSKALYSKMPPELQQQFDDLRRLGRYYSKNTFSLIDAQKDKLSKERLDELSVNVRYGIESIRVLSEYLTRKSYPFRVARTEHEWSTSSASEKLKYVITPSTMFIEFVRFRYLNKIAAKGSNIFEWRYAAIMLNGDTHDIHIELLPSLNIDDTVQDLIKATENADESVSTLTKTAFSQIIEPIYKNLQGKSKLIIAADGALVNLPFGMLHDGAHYLIDNYEITYVTSGRDLLRPPPEGPPHTDVVVLAAPAFAEAPQAEEEARRQRAKMLSQPVRSSSFLRPEPLPNTEKEAASIKLLLPQAQIFLGLDASETVLLTLAAPGILHVATHGGTFDEKDITDTALRSLRGARFTEAPKSAPGDPLLRSYLLLAGAGKTREQELREDPLQQNLDDGVTTALEVAGMDLWGTQLVVLSTCRSGRSDSSPGLLGSGLRRAVFSAGAETLVLSLWRVLDEETKAFMEQYYYRLIVLREPRIAALRNTALNVRSKHAHPYYWAAFIGLGNDTPLRGIP